MGKPKKVVLPKIDNDFVLIKDVAVGQKVFFSQETEPFEVVTKTTRQIEVTTVELKNGRTKLKVSGNQFVSKTPMPIRLGSENGGGYGRNGFTE